MLVSECPDVKNCKLRLNPVWHSMFYSCNSGPGPDYKTVIQLRQKRKHAMCRVTDSSDLNPEPKWLSRIGPWMPQAFHKLHSKPIVSGRLAYIQVLIFEPFNEGASEHGLTSPPTQYRLSGSYRSKDPTNSVKVLKEDKNKHTHTKQEAKLSLGQQTVLPHSRLVISDCC